MLDGQIARQRPRLADLLSFVRQNVPYYRRVISSDVDGLVSNSQRWLQLPMLEKRHIQDDWTSFLVESEARQIQADWEEFLAGPGPGYNPPVRFMLTSGSTGTPLMVVRHRSELRAQLKRLWMARARWYPAILRGKQLFMYRGLYWSRHQTMMRLGNDRYVDFSIAALSGYVDSIAEFEPDWIYGPPSAIYRLAQYYQQQRLSIPTLKMIELTGELLYPYQRDLIESVFNCPAVNHYGCRELWVLSFECPARAMHAWTEDLLIEVIRDGQPVAPGETGEIVVTSLTNRIMPLIRYRVGDLVQMSPSECPCGDPRPVLTPVEGRVGSFIVTREKTISSSPLEILIADFIRKHPKRLVEYQVVQTDYDRLELYLAPGESFETGVTTGELAEAIRQILPEVDCKFTLCAGIANMPSGKTKTFISLSEHLGWTQPTQLDVPDCYRAEL